MKQNKTQKRNTTVFIRRRILAVTALMAVVGFGVLCARLAKLQIVDYEMYQAMASSQQLRSTTIPANRGVIYDTNMKVLAQSATVWNLSLSPKEIDEEDRAGIAKGLAELLGVDEATLLEKMENSESYYESVAKKVEKPTVDAVRQWLSDTGYTGVNLDQDTKRYYPYGDFAAAILGFVGTDNTGLAGLEAYYDEELSGTPGRSVQATNARGSEMPYTEEAYYDAQDGNSLVLTVDETIQHSLETNLELAVKTHNVSERAVGIVMDVNTGAILGMATESGYDPNDPFTIYDEAVAAQVEAVLDDPATEDVDEHKQALSQAQQEQWRNKAVNDLYEPGSVFKTVTAAAALDSGAATIHSSYSCSGYMTVAGTVMRCAHTEGHGVQSLLQAYDNSCNPAFMQIGAALGADRFYDYLVSFGLTEKTGIDLPGESQSLYYDADGLGPVQLASCSFGQSLKITPIQMITAVATAVNGGNLAQPHVVSKILDASGNIIEDCTPAAKRQVISEETSALMRQLMEEACVTNAKVAGYSIGGKSGTSQKLDSGDAEARIASYVAVAPIDDPQIAVLIILDEPHSYSDYGGVIAAPVAGKVLSDVLPYIGIQPVYAEGENVQSTTYLGDYSGQLLVEAQSALQNRGFFQTVVGSGTTVVRQFPAAGSTLPKGSTVVLYTDESADQMVTVPSVVGHSVSSAEEALASAGLNIYRDGAQAGTNVTAVLQSVEAGTSVPRGTVVTVTFADNTLYD
ncbi:MAG: PASTA domain-containing protein [Pygmaiobacter massiliensis]|nr:PASTA domain-containing protein [Pygmaiobacter massiliensis]